ncbi:MAG: DUF998 domain-containing protein [Candidatus Nezhaarchaeales archaeon]
MFIGWVTILISIILNPWFSLYRNALSDLGAIGVSFSYVFNGGLIVASFLALAYGCTLILKLRGRLGRIGGVFFSISSIFLTLVSTYPEGTRPHYFVSVMFFSFLILSMIVVSIWTMKIKRALGIVLLTLSVIALIFALIPWTSVGMLEVSVLIVATLWLLMFAINTSKTSWFSRI